MAMLDPVLIQLLQALGATIGALGLYKGLQLIYSELTSPLRDLPGPENPSWIYGNFKEIWNEANSVPQERWVQQHGTTLKYKGLFGVTRLFTMDTKALNHVLMNTNIYQKPEPARYNLGRIVGGGVLVVEGEKHKQQRKVMNPAFGPTQIRELTEIFMAKSEQVSPDHEYLFNDLPRWYEDDPHPYDQSHVPTFAILDPEIEASQKTMTRIGNQLLRESKLSAQDKSTSTSRDLLSLLVHSNMSTDVPAHQRMSDEDVVAQVPTFLVAGHETTSTATTWALFALSQDIPVQTKLREELLAVETDRPTMDELNALPYLDMVVRETLRLHAPVPATIRQATQDDILPLNKPFTDRKGVVHEGIRVRKGQTLQVPILAINRSKEIWGDDAPEFKPERWESTPEAAASIPGVWGNMLTFLGGPRSCIGYRFSLVEMKALLFTLVRAFEFELAVPVEDVDKKSTIVQRPVLKSEPKGGNQLPMFIRPHVRV
ncbi:hypothetical protein C0991_009833 [Blastosporella zonata]|nr:hypothetical protein C0991_009833 [Blastosporella zonata]